MNKTKINLNDYSRILLSETAPADVPIIFTNNWFYQKIKNKKVTIQTPTTKIIQSVIKKLYF